MALVEDKARLGSTPPSCHNRCNGCHPCMPTQVPTLPTRSRFTRVDPFSGGFVRPPSSLTTVLDQYSNYKPMGWKCHCNGHFYNPWNQIILSGSISPCLSHFIFTIIDSGFLRGVLWILCKCTAQFVNDEKFYDYLKKKKKQNKNRWHWALVSDRSLQSDRDRELCNNLFASFISFNTFCFNFPFIQLKNNLLKSVFLIP